MGLRFKKRFLRHKPFSQLISAPDLKKKISSSESFSELSLAAGSNKFWMVPGIKKNLLDAKSELGPDYCGGQ